MPSIVIKKFINFESVSITIMIKDLYHRNSVNLSDLIKIKRFDKGLIRYSFNLYPEVEPMWIHIGISFEAGNYLKHLLNNQNLIIPVPLFLDLVLEAGFKFPLDRVIYVEKTDDCHSLFEHIDNYIWNKPHRFNDEDLYFSYQITYDIKERFDKLNKEEPNFDPYVEMFTILTNSDFTFYNIEKGFLY